MKDSNAYLNKGSANFRLRNYEEAIKDYSKAIELNPSNGLYYYNRGNAKNILGKY